jgi:hypothetical protein
MPKSADDERLDLVKHIETVRELLPGTVERAKQELDYLTEAELREMLAKLASLQETLDYFELIERGLRRRNQSAGYL